MLALDTIDFRTRTAGARLVNVARETLVGGEFPFSEAATSIANIRSEIRPLLLDAKAARIAEIERLATEVGAVDAT